MLSCRDVVTGASDYKDKNLPWHGALSYRFHLLMCHHCRKFFRQFVSAIGVASTIAAAPPSGPEIETVVETVAEIVAELET